MSFRNDPLGLMRLYMAFLAKRYAIVDIVSKRLMGSPRLDVVSMKVHAASVALLAGVIVTMEHLFAPLFVLVSATRNLTFGLASSCAPSSLNIIRAMKSALKSSPSTEVSRSRKPDSHRRPAGLIRRYRDGQIFSSKRVYL